MVRLAAAVAALLFTVCGVGGLPLDYLPQGLDAWNSTYEAPALGKGNAVTMPPDESAVYVTSANGVLTKLNPDTGAEIAKFDPTVLAANVTWSCMSGVSFYPLDAAGFAASGYLVYSIINTDTNEGHVVAFNASSLAAVRWLSAPIGGVANNNTAPILPGTPVITSVDGSAYVLFTYNSGNNGYFAMIADNPNGGISSLENLFFNETTIVGYPNAPVGVFHDPVEGYYDLSRINGPNGRDNTNTIAVWGVLQTADFALADFTGETRAFQFPVNFTGTSAGLETILLQTDGPTGWQTYAAPTLAAQGRSLFFGCTRSRMRVWYPYFSPDVLIQQQGRRFDRNRRFLSEDIPHSGQQRQSFPNSPTLSHDERMFFVGGGQNSFYGKSWNATTEWQITTTTVCQAKPLVSPDDKRVYFIESTQGQIHSAEVGNGADNTIFQPESAVNADFSLTDDGTKLIFAEDDGTVRALTVANDIPSNSPSASPSMTPTTSMMPSSAPSGAPTATPTTSVMPSHEPSHQPSRSSMPTVSAMPSEMPSGAVPTPPTSPPTPNATSPNATAAPSDMPSAAPSATAAPSDMPSAAPSNATAPSPNATAAPSAMPSAAPSNETAPSPNVTAAPSMMPSGSPSEEPTAGGRQKSELEGLVITLGGVSPMDDQTKMTYETTQAKFVDDYWNEPVNLPELVRALVERGDVSGVSCTINVTGQNPPLPVPAQRSLIQGQRELDGHTLEITYTQTTLYNVKPGIKFPENDLATVPFEEEESRNEFADELGKADMEAFGNITSVSPVEVTTMEPSKQPTEEPTKEPTEMPSKSMAPSAGPSKAPSDSEDPTSSGRLLASHGGILPLLVAFVVGLWLN